MATMTLSDLPLSRALDYQAMRATRGGAGAPWVFGAFRPFLPDSARVAPIVFNQINFVAEQLTLQFQNINVENSAPNATINVDAAQDALAFKFAPIVVPLP